jgi:serine/threonine-protein kinase
MGGQITAPRKIGRYELEHYLGGGMAAVYRARDTVMGRVVAIKLLRPESCHDTETRARFLREAQLMARVEHDNILRVYDYGEWEGIPFLVMEYLRGEDLSSAIREKNTGTVEERSISSDRLLLPSLPSIGWESFTGTSNLPTSTGMRQAGYA